MRFLYRHSVSGLFVFWKQCIVHRLEYMESIFWLYLLIPHCFLSSLRSTSSKHSILEPRNGIRIFWKCKGYTSKSARVPRGGNARKHTQPNKKKGEKAKNKNKASQPVSNNRIRRYFRNSDTDNANKACSSQDSMQDYSFPRIGSSSTSPPSTDVQH